MAENPFAAPTNALDRAAPTAAAGLVSVEQQRAIAEVQARMIIARANPRDPMRATDLILQDCTRLSLAEGALYQYARGGTDISGPSIKLAESIARRWGNIASGIKEIDRRDGFSECIAYAWDLETGYYDERQFRVRHWRDTKRGGYRLEDERDVYEVIANMGQRRKRAVLLSVIPGDVVEAAVQQCEQTLHAQADTSPEALTKMVESFARFSITREMIEARIQRRLEAVRPAQVVQLRKIWASLNDQMSAPGDWFEGVPAPAAAPPAGNEGLRVALAERAEGAAAPPSEPAPHAIADPPKADPTLVIKPLRRRGGGWDWPKYADQVIAAAKLLQPDQVEEFRSHNDTMLGSLRVSDATEFARVEAALTQHQADQMTDDRDQTTEIR